MANNKTTDILEALKSSVSEKQSLKSEVVLTHDDFEKSNNQMDLVDHNYGELVKPPVGRPDPELLFLPLSVQSSWLPAKGFTTFHRRKFGNSQVVCESRRLPNGMDVGLPTGIQARRILMATITRSVQKKSRHIHVPSLVELMEWAGLKFSGKRHRAAQRTLLRLCMMDVAIWFGADKSYELHDGKIYDSLCMDIEPNTQGSFDFIPKEVVFTEKFYNQVIENRSMPFDRELIFQATSPIEHDLLVWLITRQADWRLQESNRGPVKLSYEILYPQFAREWQDMTQFRYWFKKALRSVVTKFNRNVEINKDHVLIRHQPSSVPLKKLKL